MRLRKKWWAKPELEESSIAVVNPTECKGRWKEVFGNDNDIHLELGCGFGTFITSKSVNDDSINYIGIDLKEEVLVYAKRKLVDTFKEAGKEPNNVKLMRLEISTIADIFDKDEISKIYINFCNPWPKGKHNKRRLTHNRFLEKYKTFIKPNTEIWFKTDDKDLFEASQEYFKESGFDIRYITYDLHNSGFQGNIVTEYERKFSEKGMNIMFLVGKLK